MIMLSGVLAENHAKTMRMVAEYRAGWASLDQLRRALESHFFIEEKAVFSFKELKDPELVGNTMRLVKEHNDLLDLLNEIEDSKGIKKQLLMQRFMDILGRHSKYEDDEFYPSLDRNLSNSQKLVIIRRIRQYENKPYHMSAMKVRH